MVDTRQFILEARRGKKSKGKKGKGDSAKRSRFLSVVMQSLAGDDGKAMAEAIEAKNLETFENLWNKATQSILSRLKREFSNEKET